METDPSSSVAIVSVSTTCTTQQNIASDLGCRLEVFPEINTPCTALPPSYEESVPTVEGQIDLSGQDDADRAAIYHYLCDAESNFDATFDRRHRQAGIVQLQNDHSNGWYDGCFTRSCVCDYTGRHVIPEYITSGSLYRGRVLGWKIFRQIVLPLIGDVFRIVWAVMQFLMSIILLCLSCFNYVHGRREVYNIVHLSLSTLAFVLASIDLGGSIVYKIMKCRSRNRYRQLHRNGSTQSLGSENDHNTATNGLENPGHKAKFAYVDILRLIISELLLFPIVICDIFMLINDKVFALDGLLDWTSFIELLFSITVLVVLVYVLRLALLSMMTYRVHTKRSLPDGLHPTQEAIVGAGYDPQVRKNGLIYMCFLIFNVVTHMINQIAMILAIGVKIYNFTIPPNLSPPTASPTPCHYYWECNDNDRYDYGDNNLVDPNKLQFNFWFMLFAGYVLPIVGAWLFFSVTHFWLQEFSIGITVDYLGILKLPGAGGLFFPECTYQEAQGKVNKILTNNKYNTLRQDYHALRNYNVFSKAFYPFKSVSHSLMCLAYTTVQAIFIYVAAFSIQGNHLNMAVFLLVVITELLSNMYTLLVALFWIAVAVVIVTVILLLLGVSIKVIICVAICCADVLDSHNRGPPQPPVMTPQIRMGLQEV